MNCQETEPLLHGYVDGELDLLKHLEIERHLRWCSACASAHQSLQAVRTALERGNLSFRPPGHLEERIRLALRRERGNLGGRFRSWSRPVLAASLLLAVLGGWGLGRLYSRNAASSGLIEELLASHVRSQMLASHRVDVESTDQHTVKPWFEGKLDFAPPVQDLSDQGFPLVGGRLDYIERRPVAVLVYQRRKHPINLYIWPSGSSAGEIPETLSRRGYQVRHWTQDGMTYFAVSDLNDSELQDFAKLFQGQSPHE